MSWMDSWSRPSKSQATPAPLYLSHGDSARRANTSKAAATSVKYCSDKCKKHKPTYAPGSLEVRIADALTALLLGLPPPPPQSDKDDDETLAPPAVVVKPKQKPKKGDPRLIIQLSEVETAVFGDRSDPEKTYGRRKNRRARFVPEKGEWKSVDMESSLEPNDRSQARDNDTDPETEGDTADSATDNDLEEVLGGGVSLSDNPHVRVSQSQSDVNFSVGGERGWAEKISETPEMLARRREGQKRAEEKESVKCAARRAVAFGLMIDAEFAGDVAGQQGKSGGGKRGGGKKNKGVAEEDILQTPAKVSRKCEALMNDQVVEPSFAKGDWSIRWRED
ncbi:hypothetical protein LTR86_005732 [Recurvomyces mirabilis]|nr:hypothetical protein LTR86_005732 [Recurvomyces mirabilis]